MIKPPLEIDHRPRLRRLAGALVLTLAVVCFTAACGQRPAATSAESERPDSRPHGLEAPGDTHPDKLKIRAERRALFDSEITRLKKEDSADDSGIADITKEAIADDSDITKMTKKELADYKSRLKSIRDKRDDELVGAAANLGIQDPKSTAVYMAYLADQTKLKRMERLGLRADHPDIVTAKAGIERRQRQLEEGAKAIRLAIEVKVQQVNAVLVNNMKSFVVLGAVAKPGAFYLPEDEVLTLLQAIGRAGGYSKTASSRITVKRAGSAAPIKLDAKRMPNEVESVPSFLIGPGDVITVGESVF